MEKKTIVARLEVLEGKEREFLTIAGNLIEGTRAEEGNISYTLYQSPEKPVEFIFYEEYKNPKAITTHAASAHFKAFEQAVGKLLAKELIIETF